MCCGPKIFWRGDKNYGVRLPLVQSLLETIREGFLEEQSIGPT